MSTAPPGGSLRAAAGLRYGALGLPLAFVALPLYVVLPSHYAQIYGVPLASLGALLLGVRALDAIADPLIGRGVDRAMAGPRVPLMQAAWVAALLLALAFAALFFPTFFLPALQGNTALLAWCGVGLVVAYLAFSALSVLHQAWGARLGGDEPARARIVAWREGLALLGVIIASVLPGTAGLPTTCVVLAVALALGLWGLGTGPAPAATSAGRTASVDERGLIATLWQPLRLPAFRRLLLVFLLNGVASAVPATLVLFFIRDQLQAPAWEPAFLGAYFAAAALSLPVWVKAVARFGLARCWLAGMALAMATFLWAAGLGAGDTTAFVLVCIGSGLALGADLTAPPALLAGLLRREAPDGSQDGAFFGWWQMATKLNLALAAGLALPLLQWLGYVPGQTSNDGHAALSVVYAVVPCGLKAGAAGALWWLWLSKESS
ncbi:MFS transporter [Ideonella margarita]|uniref:MFS transporter n=1 Tax=Ideonella margarita TaxID=2984191 RepID=A0ABU9C9L8_9BURK